MRTTILAALLAPTLASAADLNARVVPSPPTIKSEIRRGVDAANACNEVDLLGRTGGYVDCIGAIQSASD